MARSPPGRGDGGEARGVSRRRVVAVVAGGLGLGAVGLGRLGDRSGPAAGGPAVPPGGDVPTPSAGLTDEGGTVEAGAGGDGGAARGPVIGANLNGRPRRLLDYPGLIDASDTSWVRAFIDVRAKLDGGGRPEDDPDVRALRRVARGCRLVVSLKWDFRANWGDKPPIRVPTPGSPAERDLHRCAGRYLAAIGAPVDVVVLGNEPLWETLEADIRVPDSPVVEFTRRAKEHLVGRGDLGDPTYLLGAFNRAHDDAIRRRWYPDFFRDTFEMAGADPDVDGVDLHLHYDALSEAEEMLATAREALPDGTIVATEVSPVHRYRRFVDAPIGASAAGERFAREHDLPPGMTAVEYFEHAKRNPPPAATLGDFYAAMPWYNVDFVEDAYDLLDRFDVEVGTVGFLQSPGMRAEDWTDGWEPFHINFLYQPALADAADGVEHTAHPHYLDDYRRRTARG